MIHAIIFTSIFIVVTQLIFKNWLKRFTANDRNELYEEFGWRCIPAYVISIFIAFFASFFVLWNISHLVDNIYCKIAGIFIIEVGCFGYCLILAGGLVTLAGNYIQGDSETILRKFLSDVAERAEEENAEYYYGGDL